MIWTLFVILVLLWLFGWGTATAGSLIHLLAVLAVIVLLYQLLWVGRSGGPPPTL